MFARLATMSRAPVMWAGGVIRSKDGSISLTKLGAATFHLGLAVHANIVQWNSPTFLIDMWTLYGSFAVLHATADKGIAVVKDFKEKKLEADTGKAPQAQ